MDVLLIDGGYLRACYGALGFAYNKTEIVKFASRFEAASQFSLDKTIYYDCPQYRGKQLKPISGDEHIFQASDGWLNDLAKQNGFAVRRGQLKFRGWTLKNQKQSRSKRCATKISNQPLNKKVLICDWVWTLQSFAKCGLRHISSSFSGDTDLIPAMKKARKTGIKIGVVEFEEAPTGQLHDTLKMHADYCTCIKLA